MALALFPFFRPAKLLLHLLSLYRKEESSSRLTETSRRELTLVFFRAKVPFVILNTMATCCTLPTPLETVLLQLQGQCLMTAGLRDENLYISVTTSQDVDGSLGRREKACTCLVRQERDGDAAKPHPNSLRHWAADSKAQHYCTPPAGLQFLKTASLAALAGMGRASFSSTRSSSRLHQ